MHIHQLKGHANSQLGRFEAAAEAYRAAARLKPDDQEIRRVLAQAEQLARSAGKGRLAGGAEDGPRKKKKKKKKQVAA